jgi:hypothetical protein
VSKIENLCVSWYISNPGQKPPSPQHYILTLRRAYASNIRERIYLNVFVRFFNIRFTKKLHSHTKGITLIPTKLLPCRSKCSWLKMFINHINRKGRFQTFFYTLVRTFYLIPSLYSERLKFYKGIFQTPLCV